MGFEPMTSCLLDRRSNQLSYGARCCRILASISPGGTVSKGTCTPLSLTQALHTAKRKKFVCLFVVVFFSFKNKKRQSFIFLGRNYKKHGESGH